MKPHLWLIHLLGVIVPRRLRADWRHEWEAELRSREETLTEWDRLGVRNKIDLLQRSTSAFWDAICLQPRRLEDEMVQDLRYGLRMLVKNPGFSLVAVLTLALGIGSTTAIFSVAHAVMLRPYSFPQPERLVVAWETMPGGRLPYMFASPPNYADWRERQTVFEEMGAFSGRGFFLRQDGDSVRVQGVRATASLFDVLKVAPALGRVFNAVEDSPNQGRVVVLSHALWQSQFGGDPHVIERRIFLDDQSYTIVGVMPAQFRFPPPIGLKGVAPEPRPELWVPFALDFKTEQRGGHFLKIIARLKPGVAVAQANAELAAVAAGLNREYPQTSAGWGAMVVPFADQALGDARQTLWTLLAAVSAVLLIACVNVANLLLARGAGRRREFAVRAALGASRLRMTRQLLTESALLGLFGGLAGLALAWWAIKGLVALAPANIPRLDEAGIDWTVVGFASTISFLSGLVFGLAPALRSGSADLNQALKEGGRSIGASAKGLGLRDVLVVAEVALSMALLVGAGLLFQSFLRLRGVDTGFQPNHVLTLRLDLPQTQFTSDPQRATAFEELERRLGSLPELDSAGFVHEVPLAAGRQGTTFRVEGAPPPEPGRDPRTQFSFATPGYFQAMQIPLLAGRSFTGQDTLGAPNVILVNRALARSYFPNENPIGKQLLLGFSAEKPRRIIGIIGDELHSSLRDAARPGVYAPYFQVPSSRSMSLAVRSRVASENALAAVREQIRSVVGSAPIYEVRTMDQILSQSISQPRFSSLLLGLFSLAAILLASLGIYGVLSYSVNQRVQEIGVRIAVGAQTRHVLGLIVGQGMKLVAGGIATGLLLALGLTQLMKTLLFGVSATDPATFAVVALLLTGVAGLACYLPARKATRIDPITALRHD